MKAGRYPRSPAPCWPSYRFVRRTDLCWPPLHSGLANSFIFTPSGLRKTVDFVLERRVAVADCG